MTAFLFPRIYITAAGAAAGYQCHSHPVVYMFAEARTMLSAVTAVFLTIAALFMFAFTDTVACHLTGGYTVSRRVKVLGAAIVSTGKIVESACLQFATAFAHILHAKPAAFIPAAKHIGAQKPFTKPV